MYSVSFIHFYHFVNKELKIIKTKSAYDIAKSHYLLLSFVCILYIVFVCLFKLFVCIFNFLLPLVVNKDVQLKKRADSLTFESWSSVHASRNM